MSLILVMILVMSPSSGFTGSVGPEEVLVVMVLVMVMELEVLVVINEGWPNKNG
jgi:hypothetical protein